VASSAHWASSITTRPGMWPIKEAKTKRSKALCIRCLSRTGSASTRRPLSPANPDSAISRSSVPSDSASPPSTRSRRSRACATAAASPRLSANQSASTPNGRSTLGGEPRKRRHSPPSARTCSTKPHTRRVLPIPGSPCTTTVCGVDSRPISRHRSANQANSWSRPIRGALRATGGAVPSRCSSSGYAEQGSRVTASVPTG